MDELAMCIATLSELVLTMFGGPAMHIMPSLSNFALNQGAWKVINAMLAEQLILSKYISPPLIAKNTTKYILMNYEEFNQPGVWRFKMLDKTLKPRK